MVCLPLDLPPPWNWHFWVLLVFSAGLPHWNPVREDCAVQRAQHIRPPAVFKNGWGLITGIASLEGSQETSGSLKVFISS